MQLSAITIASKIDPKTFYRFAIFDTLKLRKRWISPAIFAGIFLSCAIICFFMVKKTEGAALLGTVLLIVGLGVPAVYFGAFFHSLKLQSKTLKLKAAAVAYTVTMDASGVHVTSGRSANDHADFTWKQIFGVYEQPGCVYLYVSPRQAFLLPQISLEHTGAVPRELCAIFTAHLPAEKLHFTSPTVNSGPETAEINNK